MATKQWPSNLPEWATTGVKVEPTAAKKSLGWVGGGEKPPYQTFNWWQDNVFENVAYIKTVLDPYPDLQSAIESAFTGLPSSVIGIPPRFVSPSLSSALEKNTSVNLGPVAEAGADLLVCSDGRYVCTMTAADTISVYNQTDLTLFTTITLGAPPVGSIQDLKSNGFYVAVAYDGKIDLFDISTQALEHSYVHTTGGLEVFSIELLADNFILFSGNAANGGGSTPANDNIGIVDDGGTLFESIQQGAAVDVINHISWWDGNLACYNFTNQNLSMLWFDDNAAPGSNLKQRWNTVLGWPSVAGLALNSVGLAVVGRPTAVPTTETRVYAIGADTTTGPIPLAGKVLASDTFYTGAPWIMNVACDETRFFVTADSDGTPLTDSNIFVYEVVGSSAELIRTYDYQFDSTVPGRMVSVSTDFDKIYVMHELTGGGDETIQSYGLGTLPGFWNVTTGTNTGHGVKGPTKLAYPTR